MTNNQAIFAAGCFWGIEEKFLTTDGVIDTEVGYTGGITSNPTYHDVCAGDTGHAEAVRVKYDNKIISFWISQTVKKRLDYCISIFPKVKDRFFNIEHMTTNASRFNSLKQSSYEIMRDFFIDKELVVEDDVDNMIEQNNAIAEDNDIESDTENNFTV